MGPSNCLSCHLFSLSCSPLTKKDEPHTELTHARKLSGIFHVLMYLIFKRPTEAGAKNLLFYMWRSQGTERKVICPGSPWAWAHLHPRQPRPTPGCEKRAGSSVRQVGSRQAGLFPSCPSTRVPPEGTLRVRRPGSRAQRHLLRRPFILPPLSVRNSDLPLMQYLSLGGSRSRTGECASLGLLLDTGR